MGDYIRIHLQEVVCGFAVPGQEQLAETCECVNEPSVSIKCREFIDRLQTS